MTPEQVLDDVRRRGESVPLGDLAARLVASPTPLPVDLARTIVAGALGCSAESLSDPLPVEALGGSMESGLAAIPLERAAFCVVDLETTGLSPTRASIIEIGAVRIEGLRICDSFDTLVDPGVPIPRQITQLTGIDGPMLSGAPSGSAALRRLRAWLDRTPAGCFTAHNARFDAGFVGRGFATWGLPPLAEPIVCTRLLARRVAPELRRFGLEALAEGLGLRFRARHRALGDAEVTAEALLHLLERAGEQGVATLADLMALQAKRPPPFPKPGARPPGGRALTLG